MQLKSLLRASGTGLLLAAVAAFGALGCREDRETMMPIVGDTIFPFGVDLQLARGMPAGSQAIMDFQVAAADTTIPNAFERATGEFFYYSPNSYVIDPAGKNMTADPRLPALGGLGTESVDPAAACYVGAPDFWGGTGGWDFWCFLAGLKPATDYTMMLVRHSTTINGGLDIAELGITGAVATPDALSPLGGSPGGYPTELCDFDPSRPTFTTGVTGTQNPLVLGYVTSDDQGLATFDCLVGSGGFWKAGAGVLTVPDSAPFGPNDFTAFGLPRYNYVVIVEGTGTVADPVPTGDRVLRFQVAVDLDASGNPINNGLAPFSLTKEEVLAAGCCAGKVGELTVAFTNLPEVASTYQVWLHNAETGEFFSPTGTFTATNADGETMATATDVQSFNTQDDWINTFNTTNPESGDYTHAFLSVESAPASAPSATQLLWAQYTDMAGAPTDPFAWSFIMTAGMEFGTYAAGGVASPFAYGGVGRGGFYGSEARVNFVNVPRPPVGYYYEAWLVPAAGEPVNIGPLTGPYPEYAALTDLDVAVDPPEFVVNDIILQSTTRAIATTANNLLDAYGNPMWYDFSEYRLTLTLKDAAPGMPLATALGGLVPDLVKAKKPPEP